MGKDITRVIIETTVRRALKDLRRFPKRTMRNLVDLALNFAKGRFQQEFFRVAQALLADEDSAYYRLVQDVIANVDEDTLVTCGINLGYNSFTRGAKTIRQVEAEKQFNIPWALSLRLAEDGEPGRMERYRCVLQQGMELGIYTYLLYPQGSLSDCFALVEAHPDCAFLVFCRGEALTEDAIRQARQYHNLQISVALEEGTGTVCTALRKAKLLYSVHVGYGPETLEQVLDGTLLRRAEECRPVFTFFCAREHCTDAQWKAVYGYVCATRKAQTQPTVPMELLCDNMFIDSIISDDACAVAFDTNGTLIRLPEGKRQAGYNIFQSSLYRILLETQPKRDGTPNYETCKKNLMQLGDEAAG
ncbi:MAG: hypothetical protein LUG45_06580 [Clostridiales bacterium]|nr:hypothetical protein [Clostridiales bacterium]